MRLHKILANGRFGSFFGGSLDELVQSIFSVATKRKSNIQLLLGKLVENPEKNIIEALFKTAASSTEYNQKLDFTLVYLVGRASGISGMPDVRLLKKLFLKAEELGISLPVFQGSFEYMQQYIAESKDQSFHRKIPSEGMSHAPIPDHLKGTPLFADEEILRRSDIRAEERVTPKSEKFLKRLISENGKTVIQQQSKASCVHTCIAMLIFDEGKTPSVDRVFNGRYTLASREHHQFEAQNLKAKDVIVKGDDKEEMTQALKAVLSNGSCIVNIGGEIGGHAIILDSISEDNEVARIRDPYHGWEIEITMTALLKRIGLFSRTTFIDR